MELVVDDRRVELTMDEGLLELVSISCEQDHHGAEVLAERASDQIPVMRIPVDQQQPHWPQRDLSRVGYCLRQRRRPSSERSPASSWCDSNSPGAGLF